MKDKQCTLYKNNESSYSAFKIKTLTARVSWGWGHPNSSFCGKDPMVVKS